MLKYFFKRLVFVVILIFIHLDLQQFHKDGGLVGVYFVRNIKRCQKITEVVIHNADFFV